MEEGNTTAHKDEEKDYNSNIANDKLDNNDEEIKKDKLSNTNVIDEDVGNEHKQAAGDTNSEPKLQITENTEDTTDDHQKQRLEQDDVTGQIQQEGGGEKQEAIGLDPEEGTGQQQEEGVQQVEEGKQEEADQEDELGYVEEPPPDPAAPLNLTDSQERLKPRFQFKPEQLAEIEQLWDLYQDYTPAYTDIKGYITETELVYMLKCLLLMTHTPEQLQELITFCVRPPHPEGHITFDQFIKMATIRQRDMPVEDELRAALQVLGPGSSGMIDKEYMQEVLLKQGHKMHPKQLNNLIKEVDIRNDGTIGIEDVIGTMCVDLTTDDMLKPKEDEEENPEA